MAHSNWTISGRTFRTISDYEAGLRDHDKIEAIRRKTDFKDAQAIEELYIRLQSGTLQFETVLGRDFDDEVFELNETYRKAKLSKEQPVRQPKRLFGTGRRTGKAAGRQSKGAAVMNNKELRQYKGKAGRSSLAQYDEQMRREILRQLIKQEKRRKLIVSCCALIAAVSLGYFSVYHYFTVRTESSAEQLANLKNKGNYMNLPGVVNKTGDTETPEILDEFKSLYIKNKSIIGWIKIDDTNIDYPVMQTSNAEYYLNHNFDQEKDKNGSIFLDPLCDVLKPSTNLIIYGHHMKSGNMFGKLDLYSKKEYYEKHKTISFDTIYEHGTYEVMYVFRSRIYYKDEITFKYYQFIDALSEAEFNSAMEAMDEMSLYDTGVRAGYGDTLLTLSTCDNSEQDGRFVVVAKRVG